MADLLKYNGMVSDMDTYVRTEAKAARDGFQRAKDAIINLSEANLKEKYVDNISAISSTTRDDLAFNIASVFGAAADYKKELSKIDSIELSL